MNRFVAVLFIAVFFLFGASASAGTTTAVISQILLYEDGDLAYVYPEGGVKYPPSCHGSNGNYMSFKLSRPRAEQYLQLLTTAMIEKKTVELVTAGSCNDQSVSDTLRYFTVLAERPLVTGPKQGSSVGGKVVHVSTVSDALLFQISGATQTNRPECATTGRFSVRKDSPHASLVLTAFATSKSLAHVQGTGLCSLWGNSEDLRWLEVCPLTGC